MNRSTRLRPALTPITPVIPYPSTTLGVVDAPTPKPFQTIARLKGQLAAERAKHAKLEAAFAKYLGVLENTCASLREAYLLKNLPLTPNQGGKQ